MQVIIIIIGGISDSLSVSVTSMSLLQKSQFVTGNVVSDLSLVPSIDFTSLSCALGFGISGIFNCTCRWDDCVLTCGWLALWIRSSGSLRTRASGSLPLLCTIYIYLRFGLVGPVVVTFPNVSISISRFTCVTLLRNFGE